MNTYRLNTILIKERAMDWMRRITQHLQENIIGPPEKALVQEKKMLRDLNFETCSAAELQAFFKDKAFQKVAPTERHPPASILVAATAADGTHIQSSEADPFFASSDGVVGRGAAKDADIDLVVSDRAVWMRFDGGVHAEQYLFAGG